MSAPRTRHLRRAFVVATSIACVIGVLTSWRGTAVAATSVASPAPSADARALGARIADLERRISELEAASAAGPGPATVRAPFVVLDAGGKTLMRVDRSTRTGYARLTVGDSSGSAAVVAATKEGGSLQLIDATDKVRLTALASATRTGITTFLRAGNTFLGTNEDGLPTFQARNLGGIAVAELKAMVAQNGRLQITDEAGEQLLIAGVSTKGVGVIKVGPGGNGPAAVMGNIALPASEIQGKKN